MEQPPENNSGQEHTSVAGKSSSLGGMLREAREKLGLSVLDVAGQIKFAPRQIEALEADDFKNLPEEAFLRGFVRSYAKILRMDAQPFLDNMPHSKAAVAELIPVSVGVPFPSEHPVHQQNMIWLGAASLLALIVILFAIWHFKSPLKQEKITKVEAPVILPAEEKINTEPLVLKSSTINPPVPVEPKAKTPAAVQSSVQATKTLAAKAPKVETKVEPKNPVDSSDTVSQNNEVHLTFGEESWTEIKDKDGNILSSQVNPPGSELRLEGSPPYSMLIGHAASVTLNFRGKQVDLTPYINKYSEVAHLNLQ